MQTQGLMCHGCAENLGFRSGDSHIKLTVEVPRLEHRFKPFASTTFIAQAFDASRWSDQNLERTPPAQSIFKREEQGTAALGRNTRQCHETVPMEMMALLSRLSDVLICASIIQVSFIRKRLQACVVSSDQIGWASVVSYPPPRRQGLTLRIGAVRSSIWYLRISSAVSANVGHRQHPGASL